MTFSILIKDRATGAFGGAAATGSLCVGGWVLRGDAAAGMSASQGAAPSTIWGQNALTLMRGGEPAPVALDQLVTPDTGADWRQLALLDPKGHTAAHTGSENGDYKGALEFPDGIVSGNLLAGPQVLEAARDGIMDASGSLPERLLAGLRAGEAAGSDTRGLQSAALLVVSPDMAPLTLRIDYADAPLDALGALLGRAMQGDYADWTKTVPTANDPFRRLPK